MAGRRDGPAEDCGGVYAYELISAATDPGNPDHTEAVAEFSRIYGECADPEAVRLTPFKIDEINETLVGLAPRDADDPAGSQAVQDRTYPSRLDELVRAVRTSAAKRELRQLIGKARLDQPVVVDAATASRMVRPYTWLLNRVGDQGVKLTSAGYLPPAHVATAMTELGLGEEWIGKGNRESQTLPSCTCASRQPRWACSASATRRSCSARMRANCATTWPRSGRSFDLIQLAAVSGRMPSSALPSRSFSTSRS